MYLALYIYINTKGDLYGNLYFWNAYNFDDRGNYIILFE